MRTYQSQFRARSTNAFNSTGVNVRIIAIEKSNIPRQSKSITEAEFVAMLEAEAEAELELLKMRVEAERRKQAPINGLIDENKLIALRQKAWTLRSRWETPNYN